MVTTVTTPSDLLVYKPSRNTYALSWKVSPDIDEDTTQFDCEVQVDSASTFDSVNLKVYNKNNVVAYQNGSFYKAFIFNDISSLTDLTLYFRVRVNSDMYTSNWASSISFTISKVTWYDDTVLLHNILPDKNVYTKEGLSNHYKIIEAYMRELQEYKKERVVVGYDTNYNKLQDSALYDVLGVLLEYERDLQRPMVEYRKELLSLWQSFLYSGTVEGVKNFLTALFGIEPGILSFKNRYGWIVFDEQSADVTNPSGTYAPSQYPHLVATDHFNIYDSNYVSLSPALEVYSRGGKGFTWILDVYNPFSLTTRHELVETFIDKIKPAQTQVFIRYWYFNGYITEGWGGSYAWGNSYFWGDQEPSWSQYIPID